MDPKRSIQRHGGRVVVHRGSEYIGDNPYPLIVYRKGLRGAVRGFDDDTTRFVVFRGFFRQLSNRVYKGDKVR